MKKVVAFFCLMRMISVSVDAFSKDRRGCDLPTRIVATPSGIKRMAPSVWLQESKKFLKPLHYTVTVEKGDTVYSLSKKNNVSIRDIINYNHLHPPFGLRVGQKLTLSNPKTHKVLKGETLYSIANAHSVDVSALAHKNQLRAPFKIAVGQSLLLPSPIPLNDCVDERDKNIPEKKKFVPFKKKQERKKVSSVLPSKQKPKSFVAPSRSGTHFLKPVRGSIIAAFGPLKNGTLNDGINIKASAGCPVGAAENGVVIYKGNDLPSYGNMVLLKHAGGWVTTYAHLKSIDVAKGATVKRGQKLGSVGTTGHVKSPQLHFELRRGRTPVNPVPYLSR
jgi:murein DD-endopeptidase MepM/ murein hydrolase activator NlpD